MKLTRKLPAFEGVAAGGTATCRIPVTTTLNQILIGYSGTDFDTTHMNEIRLMANGKPIQTWVGADLNSVNQYEGRADSDDKSVLVLDLERFGMRTKLGQELTALPLNALNNPNPIATCELQIDIDATADTPALTAKGKFSGQRDLQGKQQEIKQIRKFVRVPGGTGVYEIADLPRVGQIGRLIFVTAGTIDEMKVELDGYTAFERTTAENESQQIDGGRVPQAGVYVIDTAEDGDAAEKLDLSRVSDFRIKLDYSVDASTVIYAEYLDPLRN